MRYLILNLFLFSILSCQENPVKQVPTDYTMEIYAENLESVRSMTFAEEWHLFAGSKSGNIYYISPDKETKIIYGGLQQPVGVDYHNGDLYVSEISRILKFPDILNNLDNAEPSVVRDDFPTDTWHGWKFIKIGPDGKLYVPVGAPCNVCEKTDERYASILRMDLDGSNLEVFAHGVRNTVGFDWHPGTGDLWFTDNGRDHLGDDLPPDELNRATEGGLHFGFPYLHGKSVEDPDFYSSRPTDDFTIPQWELPAHVASLGMRFYTGKMFPEKYRGGIFIAEHGSWNRSSKIGYRVTFVKVANNQAQSYETFADEWLEGESVSGRPADVEIAPDGSLMISDDYGDRIYRIFFEQ